MQRSRREACLRGQLSSIRAMPIWQRLFQTSSSNSAIAGVIPPDLKIDHVEQVSPPLGATSRASIAFRPHGQINPDGNGMKDMFRLCASTTQHKTAIIAFSGLQRPLPLSEANQEVAIAAAIFSSFQVDIALVTQRATAQAAPEIAHLKQVDAAQRQAVQANTARIVGNIQQIGANARQDERDPSRQQRPASLVGGRPEREFAERPGLQQLPAGPECGAEQLTGAHSTQWNSAADAMVKANPQKYSYVPTAELHLWRGLLSLTDRQRRQGQIPCVSHLRSSRKNR